MQRRGNVILIATAILLLAYYFVVEKPRQTQLDREFQQESQLTDVDLSDVSHLFIVRPDVRPDHNGEAERVTFTIVDTHWQITSPINDIADQGKVNRILQAISDATILRNLGPTPTPAEYGLDLPVIVTMQSDANQKDGGSVFTLRVGNLTVDRAAAYAQRSIDADVILLPTGVRRYLATSLNEFRNRRIVNFDRAVASGFTVHRTNGSEMSWQRQSPQVWISITQRDTTLGNFEGVEAILKRLRGLRVTEFVDLATATGFPEAKQWISVSKSDGGPDIRVDVIEHNGAVYTQVHGEERTVRTDSTLLVIFQPTVTSLRDLRLLRFPLSASARFNVLTPDTSSVIVRTGNEWGYANRMLDVAKFWDGLGSL